MGKKKNKLSKDKKTLIIKPKNNLPEEPDENTDTANPNPIGMGNPPPTKPIQHKK